ncbi:hypothetical protein [Deinococcus sp. UYEF24]
MYAELKRAAGAHLTRWLGSSLADRVVNCANERVNNEEHSLNLVEE